MTSGRPVDPAHFLTDAKLLNGRKGLPKWFKLGVWDCVTRPVRETIERLEPEVHQFFPVAIIRKGGSAMAEEYWVLNCCQRADSLIPELSPGVKVGTSSDGATTYGWHMAEPVRARQSEITGLHLWREVKDTNGRYYASEQLADAFKQLRVRILDHTPVEEV